MSEIIETKINDKDLKTLTPYFQAIFFNLKPKEVINTARGLQIMEKVDCLNDQYKGLNGYKKALLIGLYGKKLGFSLIESLNNIFIYRGKLTLHTDAGKIVVFSSKQCESYSAGFNEEKQCGWCKVKRKGYQESYYAEFSIEDAKKAQLINKEVWRKYPKRMCINRASWFALRDQFSDILAGIANYEEQCDIYEGKEIKSINSSSDIDKLYAAMTPIIKAEEITHQIPRETIITENISTDSINVEKHEEHEKIEFADHRDKVYDDEIIPLKCEKSFEIGIEEKEKEK